MLLCLQEKKDGSLRFCIDFRKVNSLTVKDSHLLPHMCETLESLAGAAHFSTFDMNSGFWQVPMAEESKQYTAFTLGSMGLYECESMPFGLCNAPLTFQRLHEYLSPYGKNRNEFIVCTDNNPLTYIFSSANLDATGQ